MPVRSIRLTIIGACVAFLAALQGCSQDAASEQGSAARKTKRHLVETAMVALDTLSLTSMHTGSLRSRRVVRIYSQEEGRITALNFYEGDSVRAGDIVLALDDTLLQAELAKSIATRHQAVLNSARLQKLSGRQIVSQEEVLAAATAVEVAKAEERVLRTRLGYTQVKAPFAGVVSARLAEPGDVVARHSHVLTISDPGALITELLVSELVLPELSVGDEASVRIDALGHSTFRGRILRIHPELDARTRQGRVEVALDPVPAGARAGQFARVEFNSAGRERKVIPFASLRRDREGEFVFVVDESRLARRVGVRSGQRLAERIEVLDGLEPGQTIVVRGFLGLSDGTMVTRVGTVDQANDNPRPSG